MTDADKWLGWSPITAEELERWKRVEEEERLAWLKSRRLLERFEEMHRHSGCSGVNVGRLLGEIERRGDLLAASESREREARRREDEATRFVVRFMWAHAETRDYGPTRPCRCPHCEQGRAFLAGSGGEGT